MNTLLVTGTDTGVGKTWITCLIVRHLISVGIKAGAYKPVCSGVEIDANGKSRWSDVEALQNACGSSPPIDRVCPQRFIAPLAPNVAAGLEGRDVDDELLFLGIDSWRSLVDWLVVEGAGGVFCPLSNRSTVLDLAAKLQGPVIVTAANRLGVISHTRLAVEALQAGGLTVSAIVLNEVTPPQSELADPSISTNTQQLMHWIPDVPILHCGWRATQLVKIRGTGDDSASVVDIILHRQSG